MSKKIAIVMPAYNAGKTIEKVFQRIPDEALNNISEFIVVNDGSKDDTIEIIEKLKNRFNIKLIDHDKNKGYGGAQKTGFNEALKDDLDIIVLLHSDGQYAPELLMDMLNPVIEGKADVVGGSRMLGGKALEGGMPLIKYIGNKFLTSLENVIFRANVHSYHSGYKVYSKKALQTIPFEKYSDDFYFDSEMIVGALRNKLSIVDIPIPTRYAEETSYLNPIKYGLGVLGVIWRYLTGKI